MFDQKKGIGESENFTAHWYPLVTAFIFRAGGEAHLAILQGSLDTVDWCDVSKGRGEILTNVKDGDRIYALYWRLVLIDNDGMIDAYIGCGGA